MHFGKNRGEVGLEMALLLPKAGNAPDETLMLIPGYILG